MELKTAEDYSRLVAIVNQCILDAVRLFGDDPKWTGKRMGRFCVSDGRTGQKLFPSIVVGEIGPEDTDKRMFVVQEKAGRLARHPEHMSSRQSRNPDALPWGEWGGAIRIPGVDVTMSLTGFPELGDEAILIPAAAEFFSAVPGILSYLGLIAQYADPEPNEYAERLLAYRTNNVR